MWAAEEDLTPNHADAGAISQNIVGALRFMTADHRDTTSHKLGKIITHRAQNPEFRRFKPWVVFGHSHAPGAYVPGDIDLPLGHGIGDSIGGITVDSDFRSRIKPSHIIRGRSHNFDVSVGKTHG